ncbi:MAG TPA: HAD-IA family hydrolase [Nocardiopsis listeri]|uniref:HAD-IA family hydrolase n=1 Tax=Nocardiopsis listeri TaxID=53440 RepID=UPI001DE3C4DA|nr:HAD-IA family hydrolase [Nocardiopsis listeri]HJE58784.1 HAD-IA family hydrolase [Nocardiopsis listeri]
MEARHHAVLCDVDGVLRMWPEDGGMPAVDRRYGLAEGTLAGTAFHPDHLLPAITGRVTDQEWRAGVAAALADRCGGPDRSRALVDTWTAVVPAVNTELADLLRLVRRVVPVLLVSNATGRLESDLSELGLDDCVTDVVNSSRVGVAKPDPAIYRAALGRAGAGPWATAGPASVLFVDDTPRNVAAAEEIGFTGVLYRSMDDLRPHLEALL